MKGFGNTKTGSGGKESLGGKRFNKKNLRDIGHEKKNESTKRSGKKKKGGHLIRGKGPVRGADYEQEGGWPTWGLSNEKEQAKGGPGERSGKGRGK